MHADSDRVAHEDAIEVGEQKEVLVACRRRKKEQIGADVGEYVKRGDEYVVVAHHVAADFFAHAYYDVEYVGDKAQIYHGQATVEYDCVRDRGQFEYVELLVA